jgi:phosphate/sulfate permease
MTHANSPAPGTPQTATKAIVGAVIGAAVAGLATLYTALDDSVVTAQETVGIASAVVGSLAAVYGGVFITQNKAK